MLFGFGHVKGQRFRGLTVPQPEYGVKFVWFFWSRSAYEMGRVGGHG